MTTPPRSLAVLPVLALLGGVMVGAALLPSVAHAAPAATQATPLLSQLSGNWRSKLSPLLPQSGQLAQVMEARPRFSVAEVRRRVLDVGGDQQVLEQMMNSAQRGLPPIYDQRLKISEADFRRYLVIQQELQPSGKLIKLSVVREANRFTFGDSSGASLLRGISLDLSSGDMRFPEGFTAKPEALVITAAQALDDPLGKRSGYVWKVRGSNPLTQTALSGHFALLALEDGSILISYDRNSILRGTVGTGKLILNFAVSASGR